MSSDRISPTLNRITGFTQLQSEFYQITNKVCLEQDKLTRQILPLEAAGTSKRPRIDFITLHTHRVIQSKKQKSHIDT